MSKWFKSNPLILNEARDYLDGLMLGDGNIQCENSNTGYYRQGCKYENWLSVINEDLYRYGIESKVDNGKFNTGFGANNGSVIYSLWTCHYVEFKEMYDRWYKPWYDIDNYNKYYWHKDKDGEYFIWKKIVPKDINLSPVCLANEYLGDGHFSIYGQITLATKGFLREDIIYLAELLSETLNIKCNISKYGVIIISNRAGINTFLNYIKDCSIPSCYDYKFPKELIV